MDTSELAALVAMRDSRRLDAFLSDLIAIHAPGIKSLLDSRQYHVAQVFLSIGRYVQHTLPRPTNHGSSYYPDEAGDLFKDNPRQPEFEVVKETAAQHN